MTKSSKATKATKATKSSNGKVSNGKATKGKGKTKGTAGKSGPVTGKTAAAPSTLSFALDPTKGKGNATSNTGVDGVVRTRAQWNGYSLCSLLKWVGKNGGDIDNARALVAALGLEDTTAKSTVSCQFYAGVQLALGKKGKPKHTGKAAELTPADVKAVKAMAGM
jgi:hypothetical protein